MKFSINQIISFGFVFHLLAAFYSIGHHHCDELFQIFEFAGYKLQLNLASDLPWEFAANMRSGIQPFIVYTITELFYFFGINNPFHMAVFIRVLQALFSFFVIFKFLKVYEQKFASENIKKLLWIFGLLFWCMPYFHARFSSENFSASIFVMGLVLLFNSNKTILLRHYLFAGILFGLAFCIRFQIVFFLIGLGAWLICVQKIKWKPMLLLSFGFMMALFVGYCSDAWLYNLNTLSWWNYLSENLFAGKANQFGTSPFYFYFSETFLQLIPPFSLLLLAAFIFYFLKRPKNEISWICFPFILLHILVPHKELRFLFPLLYFMPIVFCEYMAHLNSDESKLKKIIQSKAFVNLSLVVNGILLIFFTLKPADDETLIYKKIYDVVQGEQAILLYENRNPYNQQAGLNYFRKPEIQTIDMAQKKADLNNQNTYFFQDGFTEKDLIIKQSKVYVRVYSNFPNWIVYFNFNGWLQRANVFSIYKCYK